VHDVEALRKPNTAAHKGFSQKTESSGITWSPTSSLMARYLNNNDSST